MRRTGIVRREARGPDDRQLVLLLLVGIEEGRRDGGQLVLLLSARTKTGGRDGRQLLLLLLARM